VAGIEPTTVQLPVGCSNHGAVTVSYSEGLIEHARISSSILNIHAFQSHCTWVKFDKGTLLIF